MTDNPLVIGVDFGSKDSTVLGAYRREGVKWIYTLAEGETCMATDRGFIICHPDRPPKWITSDEFAEICTTVIEIGEGSET